MEASSTKMTVSPLDANTLSASAKCSFRSPVSFVLCSLSVFSLLSSDIHSMQFRRYMLRCIVAACSPVRLARMSAARPVGAISAMSEFALLNFLRTISTMTRVIVVLPVPAAPLSIKAWVFLSFRKPSKALMAASCEGVYSSSEFSIGLFMRSCMRLFISFRLFRGGLVCTSWQRVRATSE